ncbi:MAG: SLC13 family permease [Pirellulaceae bacterium]
MTLRTMGTSARAMVAGFMLVTAVLSAFVSNTATTTMMLPIALSVIGLLQRQCDEQPELKPAVARFATCLLLSVAYSASVGGVMTIIGTPTNTFLVGFLKDSIAPEYRIEFSFAGWLPIGVSFAAIFLPTMYWILTRILFPIQGIELTGGRAMVDRERAAWVR